MTNLSITLSFCFYLWIINFSVAQNTITGKINVSGNSSANSNVNILVKNPKSMTTIAFGISDFNGDFSIKVKDDLDSLVFVFKSLTTKEHQIKIANFSQSLLIELEGSEQELPEFTIKAVKNPVSFKNDTLSYSVDGFRNANDRVIADVIKKLPGIEVLDDGKILYQGKGIQKFYIDGMDLLEGKYNLANKNLPVNAVESVQILENHQPIRILDSLVFTDKTSLNLKLSKKNVWIGTGTLGIGASPFLYEGKFSPMTFKDNLQMLYNVQFNNSGKEIGQDLKILTLEDLLEKADNQSEYKPWFNILSLRAPSLDHNRLNFNNSILLSANVLKRNIMGIDHKGNISFLHDENKQSAQIKTSYFLPFDTLKLIENHHNLYLVNNFDTDITSIKNQKRSYFKNQFQIKFHQREEVAKTDLNSLLYNQRANLPLFMVNNKYHSLKPFGKKVLDIKSDVAFRNAYQNFKVAEADMLNGEQKSDADFLNQNLNYRSFFAHHSVGMSKGLSTYLIFQGNLGIINEHENMESDLISSSITQSSFFNGFKTNNLISFKSKVYFLPELNWKKNNTILQFKLPINYLNMEVKDEFFDRSTYVNKIYFEPQAYGKYNISSKWHTYLRLSSKNEFKGIHDLHYGFLIRNFRAFQRSATNIPETLSQRVMYGLNYRDPFTNIFYNLSYSYTYTELNTMIRNEVLPTGLIIYEAIDRKNYASNNSFNFRGGKYFSLLKSSIAISGAYQKSKREQIVNQILTDVEFQLRSLGAEFKYHPVSLINFSYIANLSFINSNIGERNTGEIIQYKHTFSSQVFLTKLQTLFINWEHYDMSLNGQNRLTGFVDLEHNYKIKNGRWNISFVASNILNKNGFYNVSTDNFIVQQDFFQLRPRQVQLKLNYSF